MHLLCVPYCRKQRHEYLPYLISNTDIENIQAASERKQCPNLSSSVNPLQKIRERAHLLRLPPIRSSSQVTQDAPSTTPLQLAERDTNPKQASSLSDQSYHLASASCFQLVAARSRRLRTLHVSKGAAKVISSCVWLVGKESHDEPTKPLSLELRKLALTAQQSFSNEPCRGLSNGGAAVRCVMHEKKQASCSSLVRREKVERCMALPNRCVCTEPLPASDHLVSFFARVTTTWSIEFYFS